MKTDLQLLALFGHIASELNTERESLELTEPQKLFIKVWKYYDAPIELRSLSTNGGDEDWIALVPIEWANDYISWLEEGSSFGCCDVSDYTHPNYSGYLIKIGSHA